MDQTSSIKSVHLHDEGSSCPSCGSLKLTESWIDDEFEYGNGKDAVKLAAHIPLCHCEECGLDFTDWRAEELRHEAVCRHFNLLTPNEVVAVRERHRLTQQEFAEISKIGRASLARWEGGNILQNASSDNLIYLLCFEDNLIRLKRRAVENEARAKAKLEGSTTRKFRALSDSQVLEVRRDSASFQLYIAP